MKAFEKWDCEYCGDTDTICPISGGCLDCEEKREEGFRAALEWVLKTADELEEQDAPIFMQDVIKQELEQD